MQPQPLSSPTPLPRPRPPSLATNRPSSTFESTIPGTSVARNLTPRFSQMAKEDFQASLKRALQAARSLDKHSNKASTSAMIPKILVFALEMLAQRGVTVKAVLSAMVRRQYPEHGKYTTQLPDDIVEALLKEIDSEDKEDETVTGQSQEEKLCSSNYEARQDREVKSGEGVTTEGSQDGDKVTAVS